MLASAHSEIPLRYLNRFFSPSLKGYDFHWDKQYDPFGMLLAALGRRYFLILFQLPILP
jgi:hypothetical protein